MEFKILGPLEVTSDGRPLALAGLQQRALLVALLLEANRVVPAERLINVVWESSPPPTANKALQVHVSNLRKILGRDRLETKAPGYQLHVAPDELDLAQFERLWDEGRPHEALAVWRGAPLAEFAFYDFAQAESARLEERRLLCLEERLDADLADGRHEELVSELEMLARDHPLREGLRWRLMLALYRSSRQAEALQAYQSARRTLVEELGIEPGRTLRELHRSILSQDATLELLVEEVPAEAVPEHVVASAPPVTASDEQNVRKTVTAVSARITASSVDGGGLDLEAQRRVLGRSFGEIELAVTSHRGTVESVTGDGVIAVFGLPVVHEDDALRGIRAAADVSARLTEIAAELSADPRIALEFRVGVSTGRVITGGTSGPQPRATGEPLSLAARLSEVADASQVLFDDATWRLVRETVACEQCGDAWLLLAPLYGAGSSSARLVSPMVGRDRERRRLTDAFEQAVGDRSCQLFTVLGSAGVGKTRLIQEFLSELSSEVVVASGRCLPYGEGITYWPLLEAVKEAVGLDDSDSREIAREKILSAFADDEGATSAAERIAWMLGIAESPPAAADEGFAAVRALFEALARQRPLVVVFDDIHWGEMLFLDLVEDVADWSRDAPILLVCVARPELLEMRPGWGGGKGNSTTTTLEPLSSDDCSQLIANLVEEADVPPGVSLKIVEAAGGNPFFVEEMLFMLIEDGLLVRRRGRWAVAGDLDEVRVPPTIDALLATRLDQLDTVERAVIERASIIGKIFYEAAILDLMPEVLRPRVKDALRSLVRKELIRPARGGLGGSSYRFRHLLILDAAYEAVSKQLRADLHQRFGLWLDEAAGDRGAEYEEVVGYHLEHAYLCLAELGPPGEAALALAHEAARRLGDAGRRAFTQSNPTAGIKLVSRAVAVLAPDDPLRVELVPNVRAVQALNRDLVWADRVLTEAVEAAATSGDRLLAARALVQRGLLRLFTDAGVTPEELIDAADRSIAVFQEFRDELGLARAWRLKGQAHYLARRGGECAEASERALAHVRRASDPYEEREIVEWLVIALLLGPARVDNALRRCETLLAETNDEFLRAQIYGTMVALVTMLGNVDEAVELAARSHERLAEIDPQIWVVAFWRSFAYMARHDPASAERELLPSYDALKQLGERSHFSTITHALATALYLQGRFDEAEAMTRECEEACRPNDVHSSILWRSVRAKVLAAKGSIDEAVRLGREAVELAATSDFHLGHAQATLDLAVVYETAGREDSAAECRADAARLFELKGVKLEVGQAWAVA